MVRATNAEDAVVPQDQPAAGIVPAPDRRASGCAKWTRWPAGVLPMWVADMDLAVAEPVLDAIRARLDHPVLGYGVPTDRLRGLIVADLAARHGWRVAEEAVVFLPGVVPGFNLSLRALCPSGAGVVVQTPVYPPMLKAPLNWGLRRVEAPLDAGDGVDGAAFARACREAGPGGAFLLCNPHNPTGRVFRREELAMMAEACLSTGVAIVSDEIHADMVFRGHRHLPVAALSPEVAARTITLMSAGKTWNTAGLNTAWAVIPDPALRAAFQRAIAGVADHVNILGLVAAEAALEHGQPWREAAVAYLEANRDALARAVGGLEGVRMRTPEGTYLAWLDLRGTALMPDPQCALLRGTRLGLNPGPDFGAPGAGFVRLNFGCPRAMLEDGIGRLAAALAG